MMMDTEGKEKGIKRETTTDDDHVTKMQHTKQTAKHRWGNSPITVLSINLPFTMALRREGGEYCPKGSAP